MPDATLYKLTAPVVTNLATNPSFESALSGWTASRPSTFARSTSTTPAAPAGNYFARVSSTAADTELSLSKREAASPGQAYSARISAFTTATAQRLGIAIRFYSSVGTLLSTSSSSPVAGSASAWTTLSVANVVAPAAAVSVDVRLAVVTTGNALWSPTGVFDLAADALMLTASTTAQPFSDGNSSGWGWTGTPNLSTSGPNAGVVVTFVDAILGFDGHRDARTVTTEIPSGGNAYVVRPHGPRSGTFRFGFGGVNAAQRAEAVETSLASGALHYLADGVGEINNWRFAATGQISFERVHDATGKAWIVSADWTARA